MNSDAMFSEMILDYYRNPRQQGVLSNPHIHARDTNPSCGDVIEFFAVVDNHKRIKDIRFTGKGCAISQAAASMLAEHLLGKHVDEIVRLSKKDVLDLLGIPISPMRLKCALLGMKVLKFGTYTYLGKTMDEEVISEMDADTLNSSVSAVSNTSSPSLETLEAVGATLATGSAPAASGEIPG